MDIFFQFEKKPVRFSDPLFIIECYDERSFSESFRRIESALKDGFYIAGFFSYEAGYSFEKRLNVKGKSEFPLIYLGVYKDYSKFKPALSGNKQKNCVENLKLSISFEDYSKNIRAIRDYIAQGEVYQITYCLKMYFDFSGDPFSLYSELLKEQPVPYPAYIDTGKYRILSCSPEMFLKKEKERICAKPMKGTWFRGNNWVSDKLEKIRFRQDEKNRAENVMIADLLRNDLGRTASGIRAPKLFEVDGYKTLYQMTSTVTGNVEKDIDLYKLFASIFPSGSVTGAPKIRAMEIIKELEREERRIYTGAIGYITPDKNLFFNVPIRTILINERKAEMGIGGGIVWDSTPEGEWKEGLLKARFLTKFSSSNASFS
ncbi:MAG: aminodeoxychorismate synthase component I [Candidatus Omnitrophica bacterium]|nr:aminodeoxychorismate synthase component I [Candidatus Omnitrophota bacterium]